MKKVFYLLLFICANEMTFAQGFTVNKFSVDFYLSKEGYFDVVENYDVTFTESKHGLFREFNTKFDFQDENGKVSKREFYISNIEIPRWKYSTNEILGKLLEDKLTIKIGDKDKLVKGNQQYEIRYRVNNALFFNNNEAQLYWNVKPIEWLAEFKEINFTIHVPKGIILSAKNCFIYSGNVGNTEVSQEFEYQYDDQVLLVSSKPEFVSYYGQAVTALIKMPKNLIQEQVVPIWKKYLWVGLLLLFYLVTFILRRIFGYSKKVIPITSYYPPKNLDPAMVGILIDNGADNRDIISLLPYWATKGLIRMEEIPKGERAMFDDMKLIKLNELPEDAPGYEYNFFHRIFDEKDEVQVSKLKNTGFEPQMLLTKKFKSEFQKEKSPVKRTWGCVIGIWALAGSFLFFLFWGWIAAVANFVFCIIFSVISFKRDRNVEGNEAFAEVLGFKHFIKMADADRIKTLLIEDPLYFEKTMPYAVAFNLLKEWTTKFEGLMMKSPDWYKSTTGTQFTMKTFALSFNNNLSIAKSVMVRAPSSNTSSGSSSGGGSSGGGGGSGGGGSW